MSLVYLINCLDENNKLMVYNVLAENRSFSDDEWRRIIDNIEIYRTKMNVSEEITNLLSCLNAKEKEIFEKILETSKNNECILKKIYKFEQIPEVNSEIVKRVIKEMRFEDVVLACMGTSPDNRQYIEELYGGNGFQSTIIALGSVPIIEIEKQQLNIIHKINECL